ncbi:unnamed protein product [Prorocentrum cordatum]|uniref:Non-specific serine/threonine protein kinase n=1 Tax=Prorocentrum cordatum TaxID=2364126 RepID=A0ABN9XSK3_9DINO|nr:unnamed protein product [Polarella glacialis]
MLPIPARDRAGPVAPDAAAGLGLPIPARGYPDEQPLPKRACLGLPIAARGEPAPAADRGRPAQARGEPAQGAGLGLPLAARGGPAAGGGLGLPTRGHGELGPGAVANHPDVSMRTGGGQAGAPRRQVRRRTATEQDRCPLEAPSEHAAASFGRSRTMLIGGRGSASGRARRLESRRSLGEGVLQGAHFSAIIGTHGEEVPIAKRYTFGRMLGEGASGSTWEAWPTDAQGKASPQHSGSKGHRAIKKLTKYGASAQEREACRQEVELLKELDHPNICKLYEVFEDAAALYMVMDMCEGGELFDRIVDEELHGEAQAADLFRQIAGALRYCHETHGIMHRDIKPENVLFTTKEEKSPVKLIDFGIACFTRDALQNRQAGTEAYEAPEVLLRQDYSEKCDLWSLGALLFVILTGRLPFQSVEHAQRGAIRFEDADQVSPSARDLTARLLAVDPAGRPSAAEVLDHPWVAEARHKVESLGSSVFARLKSFKQTTALRKILLMVLSRQLTDVDLPETYEAFQQMDTNGDGKLSHSEIRAALGSRMSAEEVDQAIQAMDVDGSGNVEYSEFLAAAFDRKLLFRQDLCLQVFRALDKEGAGVISIEGLMQMMDGVVDCPHRGAVCARLQTEAKELLECFDADGDGVLDFAEFTNLLTRNSFSGAACAVDFDGLADLGGGAGENSKRASKASRASSAGPGDDAPEAGRASNASRPSRGSSAGKVSAHAADDGPADSASCPGEALHEVSAPLRATRWVRARLSTGWMSLRPSTSQGPDEALGARARPERPSRGARSARRPSSTGEAGLLSCIAGLCPPEPRRGPS